MFNKLGNFNTHFTKAQTLNESAIDVIIVSIATARQAICLTAQPKIETLQTDSFYTTSYSSNQHTHTHTHSESTVAVYKTEDVFSCQIQEYCKKKMFKYRLL